MIEPPSSDKTEITVAVAKGALSAIPVAGGLLAELGNLYLNPLERRKQKWMEDVSEALNQIRSELDVLPEQLQENEYFISALFQATEIAVRTHRVEKLTALRNALVSAASEVERDDEMASMFLRYVDELSPTHVRILHWMNLHAEQVLHFEKLEQIYSKLNDALKEKIERVIFRSMLQDLDARFLLRLGDVEDLEEFRSTQSPIISEESRIRPLSVTPLGNAFLVYIRANQL